MSQGRNAFVIALLSTQAKPTDSTEGDLPSVPPFPPCPPSLCVPCVLGGSNYPTTEDTEITEFRDATWPYPARRSIGRRLCFCRLTPRPEGDASTAHRLALKTSQAPLVDFTPSPLCVPCVLGGSLYPTTKDTEITELEKHGIARDGHDA